MRRLCFLILLFILFFCATYRPYFLLRKKKVIDYFDNREYIHYLLKPISKGQLQLLEGDTIIYNSKGEAPSQVLVPTDPSLYGELFIEKDKLDYNSIVANVSYYKRQNDFITINFEQSDEAPITFSRGNKPEVSLVMHKSSEIGTVEKRPDGSYEIKLISHPDA